MNRMSRMFLSLAGVTMVGSLVARLQVSPAAHQVSDFAVGLAAAFMVGVLVTWKGERSPRA